MFSIPNVYSRYGTLSPWWIYTPPSWFFGIDQIIVGNRNASQLAQLSIVALLGAVAAAILTYLWSYRRHRARVIESPSSDGVVSQTYWPNAFSEYLLPDSRALGVFAFVGKSLARSRQHRLILMTCAGIAMFFTFDGFVRTFLSNSATVSSTSGTREAALAVPMTFSLLLLAGFRYIFRLPVELRANWMFRITEPGYASEMLGGVERFLFYWGAIPIAIFAALIEVLSLGLSTGLIASVDCLLISLILIEALLISFDRIPFTSSYVPGQRPFIESLLKYSVIATTYIWGSTKLISLSLEVRTSSIVLILLLTFGWRQSRRARLRSRLKRHIEFSENIEPSVQFLGVERD